MTLPELGSLLASLPCLGHLGLGVDYGLADDELEDELRQEAQDQVHNGCGSSSCTAWHVPPLRL